MIICILFLYYLDIIWRLFSFILIKLFGYRIYNITFLSNITIIKKRRNYNNLEFEYQLNFINQINILFK